MKLNTGDRKIEMKRSGVIAIVCVLIFLVGYGVKYLMEDDVGVKFPHRLSQVSDRVSEDRYNKSEWYIEDLLGFDSKARRISPIVAVTGDTAKYISLGTTKFECDGSGDIIYFKINLYTAVNNKPVMNPDDTLKVDQVFFYCSTLNNLVVRVNSDDSTKLIIPYSDSPDGRTFEMAYYFLFGHKYFGRYNPNSVSDRITNWYSEDVYERIDESGFKDMLKNIRDSNNLKLSNYGVVLP